MDEVDSNSSSINYLDDNQQHHHYNNTSNGDYISIESNGGQSSVASSPVSTSALSSSVSSSCPPSSSVDSSCDSDSYYPNHGARLNYENSNNNEIGDDVNHNSPPIYANLPLIGAPATIPITTSTSSSAFTANTSKSILSSIQNHNYPHHPYHHHLNHLNSSNHFGTPPLSSSPSTSCSPPIPETGTDPNRVLLNHWSEYIHLSGRKYYYNSVTKQSSWKPPRRGLPIFRDDDENTSHSEENLTDSSSANSWSPTSNCRDTLSISSELSSATTIYSHRLKPRVRPRKTILNNLWQLENSENNKNTATTNNNNNSSSSSHNHFSSNHTYHNLNHLNHHNNHNNSDDTWSSPTLPPGWTRFTNNNQVYFINESTKVKWYCKLDDTGRLYFYEENGEKSYWHLPEVATDEEVYEESDKDWQSQSDASETYSPVTKEICERSTSASVSSGPLHRIKNEGSLRIPTRKHSSNGLSPIDRNFKAKSMLFLPTSDISFVSMDSDSEDKMTVKSISNNHSNGSHHQLSSKQQPPVPENLEVSKDFKRGILNLTKIMDNGKRLRKNWSTSLVALTDHYLLIFKDSKINSHQEQEKLKPEIAIELGGSLIEWSPGVSSRKNVFQLTTFTGCQILLQEDCTLIAGEWFFSIKAAISKLPKSDGTATIGSNTLDSNKGYKLKRSKSQKQSIKKVEIAPKLSSKNGGSSGVDQITPEKKKKIRERLINFLLRRPTLDSLREKGIFKDGPVFGCDLQSLCTREKQLVPKVVQQCIKAIEQKGLKADGIYRVCGNLSEVQKIRYQVNHDNYEGIWAQEDVHVLTGALKLFFRDMKEPLFPCNHFDSLMRTIGLPDKKRKQEAIVRVIRDLPKCHKETLKYLLRHLLRIQTHKDENRMHIQNLAIVFGPTLMWPETHSNNLAYDMMLKMHSNQVIELLLLEYENIFK